MTDKQIIKLKPMEDLNEKIIKEKGNTKCIFYADDICRNGDKTRDCVNCARVEYHSLYSLNWDNQARLQKIIKQKEQECEKLKKQIESDKDLISDIAKHNYQLFQELDQLKAENDSLKSELMQKNCYLDADKEIIDQLKAKNEELKKKKEENETFYLKKYANKDSECLNLQHKVNVLKQALTEIKQLLEDALDTDKTNAEQSFDNFYKAIKLCEVLEQ